MKMFLFKLCAVAVIVAGACNYVIYLKTGRMPAREWVNNLKNMKAPSAGEVMDSVRDAAPIGDKKVKIYTWKDENGRVHYSNQEEKVAKGAQEQMVSTKINSMQAVKPREPVEPTGADGTVGAGLNAQTQDIEEQLRIIREARKAQDAMLQQ